MDSVMSSLKARKMNGFSSDTNVAPLDAICKTTFAMSCEIQCLNFRLMHPMSVGGDVHQGVDL